MARDAKREVRSVAAGALDRVLASKTPAPLQLERARRSIATRDGALLTELVLGSLRWLRRLDSVVELAAARPLDKIDSKLLAPLRICVYQLLFLDRIPDHAAVDTAVEEVKRRSHRGAVGFANAILRRVAERRDLGQWPVEAADPVERVATELSYPTFLVRRWFERFGESRALEALAGGNRRPGVQLLCLGERDEVARELEADGVETRPTRLSPLGLSVTSGDPLDSAAFARGRCYVQDEASQAAALIPGPKMGERVLDLAAAPGGKSFALAAAEPSLRLAAADVSLPRLLTLRANRERLGLAIRVSVARAQAPGYRGPFDRVVADLPCSGTGTFARHPELKWRLSEAELGRLAEDSQEVLGVAADLVSSNGRLCVITCSVEAEENERVVEAFLSARRDFFFEGLELDSVLRGSVAGPGLWRALPSLEHDGFTVHVLRRE